MDYFSKTTSEVGLKTSKKPILSGALQSFIKETTGGSVVLLTELSVHLTVHSSPTDALSRRLARGQSSSRRGIPNTVRAAVFVLPNSIPFHSPLCALCLFWCSFTPWGLTGPEKENISPTSNPVTRPLEAASSGFLGLGERQRP